MGGAKFRPKTAPSSSPYFNDWSGMQHALAECTLAALRLNQINQAAQFVDLFRLLAEGRADKTGVAVAFGTLAFPHLHGCNPIV